MLKMIVHLDRNYLTDFDADTLKTFLAEGTPVLTFNDEWNNPEDFVRQYEENTAFLVQVKHALHPVRRPALIPE